MSDDHLLEDRLALLEDRDAIQRLMYRYAAACDFGFDLDGIAACFTPSGRWKANGYEDCRGHEEISAYFARVARRTPMALHYVTQPRVDVVPNADRAEARFHLLCLTTARRAEQSTAIVILGTYETRCIKTAGAWLFEEMRVDIRHVADWLDGWGDQPRREVER